MKVYCVQDYLEVQRWFLKRYEAMAYFEEVFYDRAQEKSEQLEVREYTVRATPSEALVKSLNGDVWVGESLCIRRAKP